MAYRSNPSHTYYPMAENSSPPALHSLLPDISVSMIIPDSEKSDSSTHSQISFGPVDVPPSPPSYSETITSNEDRYRDGSHSPQSAGFHTTLFTRPGPPRCNHLIDRKLLSSVTGNWHVDTALEIPERLLPPITDFDGRWNREAQQVRKARAEAPRRPQVWSPNSNRNRISPLVETRPNLMLAATNGAISGDIRVVSSDGLTRQSTVVAEGCSGSINLRIHAPPDQLLRVFASSTNGSINIKIPSSFEGAIKMSTSWGNVNVSQSIRAKLTTFSSTSNASRGFIGDWQVQGFGNTESHIDDPPCPGPRDPFATWTGPLIDLSSTNGSVNLSYIGEDTPSAYKGQLTRAIQGFMNSWFGGTGQNDSTGNSGSPRSHPSLFHPLSPAPPIPPIPPTPLVPPIPSMLHQSPSPVPNLPPSGVWPMRSRGLVSSTGMGGLELD